MKVVILAGGFGTRISEESHLRPKPMIEIGDAPILWHIMKIYSYYGFNDFIICCGYKGDIIKEYFANYYLHRSDITFDFSNNNEMIVGHTQLNCLSVMTFIFHSHLVIRIDMVVHLSKRRLNQNPLTEHIRDTNHA